MCSSDLFLGVLAILFPPLAVWVKCGLCSADSIINILLCVLGYIPGLLHAWYIIAKFPDTTSDYERMPQDYENGQGQGHGGRVTYVIVPAPHAQPQQQSHQQQQQPQQHAKHSNYGTASAPSNSNNNAGASSSNGASGSSSGEGNNERAPPTYAEAIKGDHKIQSDE